MKKTNKTVIFCLLLNNHIQQNLTNILFLLAFCLFSTDEIDRHLFGGRDNSRGVGLKTNIEEMFLEKDHAITRANLIRMTHGITKGTKFWCSRL